MKYSDVVYGERRKTGNYWDYDVHLEYIDTSGNVISTKTVSRSELGWNIKSSDVYNNRCIIYGAPQEDKITKMFIYNFEDNSMVQLTDEKYLNQLSGDFDFHFSAPFFFFTKPSVRGTVARSISGTRIFISRIENDTPSGILE